MGAPKGNKNALGNDGGRPPIYSNPEDLQKKVDEYFEYLKGESHIEQRQFKDEDGTINIFDETVWDRPPEHATITGLIIYIGFDSRSTFYEYKDKVEFSHIIKIASLKVEHEYEKAIRADKIPTGAIFALKNMGWSDRQTIDTTTEITVKSDPFKSIRENYSINEPNT